MIIHIFSDTHHDYMSHEMSANWWAGLERLYNTHTKPEALVLAGDVCEMSRKILLYETLRKLSEMYPDVIYVMGNHDYYGGSIEEGINTVLNFQIPNLHLLVPGAFVTIRGQRFLGGTMWYPDCKSPALKMGFPDYRAIRSFDEQKEHDLFLTYTANRIQKGDIVVTHHLPSPRSIPFEFRNYDSNCFFVADMTNIIKSRQPKLWIHGHTHSPMRYTIGRTTIYCNPSGYPSENTNKNFGSRIIVNTETV